MSTTEFENALRQAGLRVTAPRLAALAVIDDHQHIEAERVVTEVRERLGSVSRQAIYDVLNALTDAGIVLRVVPGGRGSRYELDAHDNHHHLLCRECGVLEDVPCSVGYVPCINPPNEDGSTIEIAEVLYRGLCRVCTAARKESSPITKELE